MHTREPRRHREWLEAEAEGQEGPAEHAFARLVADLPDSEPSAVFVDQVVGRVWARQRARQRRRRAGLVAASVAALGLAAVLATAVSGYLAGAAGGLLLATTQGMVWLAGALSDGLRWWQIAGRVGSALGDQVMVPGATVGLAGAELLAAMAIYAFQRTLRDARHESGKKVEL